MFLCLSQCWSFDCSLNGHSLQLSQALMSSLLVNPDAGQRAACLRETSGSRTLHFFHLFWQLSDLCRSLICYQQFVQSAALNTPWPLWFPVAQRVLSNQGNIWVQVKGQKRRADLDLCCVTIISVIVSYYFIIDTPAHCSCSDFYFWSEFLGNLNFVANWCFNGDIFKKFFISTG